jgi:hypothetical protein
MNQFQAVVSQQSHAACMLAASFGDEPAKAIERLPFTIKRVSCDADMLKEVGAGRSASARHQVFPQSLAGPETGGRRDGAVMLVAESKLDGSTLGSLRIRNNLYQPLGVEASIVLPGWLQQRRVAEISRLCINERREGREGRAGRTVRAALLKAFVVYCRDNGIEWALATERAADDGQYERLLFVDLLADRQPAPLKHGRNTPHRVMACEIDTLEARWTAAKHPMLGFFCRTHHPDIDVTGPLDANPVYRHMAVREMA